MAHIRDMKNDNLKRYAQQARYKDGRIVGGFSDWFASDDEAAADSRAAMEEQGYKVLSVSVAEQVVTVEIER